MPALFVDLNGVLADQDGFYHREFGIPLDRIGPEPREMWPNILGHKDFFGQMPALPDAQALWSGLRLFHPAPVILSGCPERYRDQVAAAKRAWVGRHIGPDVRVILCRGREKSLHGRPGDILIDDWDRHQRAWEEMGGVFILHRSAQESLAEIKAVFT